MTEQKSLATDVIEQARKERDAWRTATICVAVAEMITVLILAAVILM